MSWARTVSSALTWRKVAVMQALSLATLELHALSANMALPGLARVTVDALCAFAMLLVMLGADEAMDRGAGLGSAYPIAVVVILLLTCSINGIGQWILGVSLNLQGGASPWTLFLIRGLDSALWGSFATLAYLNRRIAERMLEAVRDADQRRVQLDRQLIDARLAAAEAEVDPKMLLGSLAEIRTGLLRAAPDADSRLEALTQSLRSSLARMQSSGEARNPGP